MLRSDFAFGRMGRLFMHSLGTCGSGDGNGERLVSELDSEVTGLGVFGGLPSISGERVVSGLDSEVTGLGGFGGLPSTSGSSGRGLFVS